MQGWQGQRKQKMWKNSYDILINFSNFFHLFSTKSFLLLDVISFFFINFPYNIDCIFFSSPTTNFRRIASPYHHRIFSSQNFLLLIALLLSRLTSRARECTRWCEKLDFHFIQFFFFLFLHSSNSHWRCRISLGRGNAAHNSRKTLMRAQQPVDIPCRALQRSASQRAKVSTAGHQLWMEIGAENEKRRVFNWKFPFLRRLLVAFGIMYNFYLKMKMEKMCLNRCLHGRMRQL